jgi:hypothetical protein
MNAELMDDLQLIVDEMDTLRPMAEATEPESPIHERAVNAGIDPAMILFILQTFGPWAIKLLEKLIERRKKL